MVIDDDGTDVEILNDGRYVESAALTRRQKKRSKKHSACELKKRKKVDNQTRETR
jgi:SOS response regulatory protein OraA/RecX